MADISFGDAYEVFQRSRYCGTFFPAVLDAGAMVYFLPDIASASAGLILLPLPDVRPAAAVKGARSRN